jgi:hypothetical protein
MDGVCTDPVMAQVTITLFLGFAHQVDPLSELLEN